MTPKGFAPVKVGVVGLCYEGNVLVHRGVCTPGSDVLREDRDERMRQLTQGLPQ
jgi:hypothetical protein